MDNLPEIKKQARKAAGEAREPAHAAAQEMAPVRLMEHRFPVALTADCNIISAFYPYQSEIDTRPLLGKLAGEGWTTALPVVTKIGQPLFFRRWFPGEPTVPGKWDIPRPPDDAPVVEPNVLLVPLLAFDRKGYRLGYGGGFYDRTLEGLRAKKRVIAIGVAYAAQEVAAVPVDEHDQLLNFVMTEKELITCG